MKKFFYKSSMLALVVGVLFTSCDPEIDAEPISAGQGVDFSKYIAVGNSLTAGFQDNGLYREGQLNSFPAILAQQLQLVGGGDFMQPLFSEAQANGSGYLRLTGFTQTASPILTPVTTNLAVRNTNPTLYTKYTGQPVQNLGIPGIKVADIKTAGYGSQMGNPYFERLAANAGQTYLQFVEAQAQAVNHTFFTNWLGNNDVLGYATAGGFSGQLTPLSTFEPYYTDMINVLTANGEKGVVATIPDVTGIPFFTTVGPNVKASLTKAGAAGFVALTRNTPQRKQIPVANIRDAAGGSVLFTLTGSSYAPLIGQPGGKYWRDLARQVSPSAPSAALNQLLTVYSIDTTQAFGVSGGNPWPSALLLDDDEIKDIKDATIAFNNVIKGEATAKNLALFDANAFFTSIQGGTVINGVLHSPAFISGNLFSLDGVHPTPRGYAIITNEVIKAINAKYNASIPQVDVTKYRAVQFPNM